MPPADLDELVHCLRELILAGEHYRVAAANALGLTVVETQVVSYLLARGPMGQNELARALNLTTGSVTALVDRLVRRELVERRGHPSDRRRSIVHLSAHGEKVVPAAGDWLRSVAETVDPQQRVPAAALLRFLAEALRNRTPSASASPSQ